MRSPLSEAAPREGSEPNESGVTGGCSPPPVATATANTSTTGCARPAFLHVKHTRNKHTAPLLRRSLYLSCWNYCCCALLRGSPNADSPRRRRPPYYRPMSPIVARSLQKSGSMTLWYVSTDAIEKRTMNLCSMTRQAVVNVLWRHSRLLDASSV